MDRERVWLLLPSPVRNLPADLAAVLAVVALTNLAVFLPVVNDSPVRVVVGLVFVLFVPGYAFIAALFPEAGEPPTTAGPVAEAGGPDAAESATAGDDEESAGESASAAADEESAMDAEAGPVDTNADGNGGGLGDRGIDGIERTARHPSRADPRHHQSVHRPGVGPGSAAPLGAAGIRAVPRAVPGVVRRRAVRGYRPGFDARRCAERGTRGRDPPGDHERRLRRRRPPAGRAVHAVLRPDGRGGRRPGHVRLPGDAVAERIEIYPRRRGEQRVRAGRVHGGGPAPSGRHRGQPVDGNRPGATGPLLGHHRTQRNRHPGATARTRRGDRPRVRRRGPARQVPPVPG
ncbi:hypothetical protein BRC85_04020 [Halobacteriales archaeon QS_1_69_70]|nr:MAG: hypothetical protein BRC85_04020 [Halobacteriales archaeon QS_1_69_70]